MNITVAWFGQLRDAADVAEQEVSIDPGATVASVLLDLAEAHGEPLASMLRRGEGIASTLLVSLDDVQVMDPQATTASPGSRLVVMAPISGG